MVFVSVSSMSGQAVYMFLKPHLGCDVLGFQIRLWVAGRLLLASLT